MSSMASSQPSPPAASKKHSNNDWTANYTESHPELTDEQAHLPFTQSPTLSSSNDAECVNDLDDAESEDNDNMQVGRACPSEHRVLWSLIEPFVEDDWNALWEYYNESSSVLLLDIAAIANGISHAWSYATRNFHVFIDADTLMIFRDAAQQSKQRVVDTTEYKQWLKLHCTDEVICYVANHDKWKQWMAESEDEWLLRGINWDCLNDPDMDELMARAQQQILDLIHK